MTALEFLQFQYPYLFAEGDPRAVPAELVTQALDLAIPFRPKCLTEELQDQAQAHYAAHLLQQRFNSQAGSTGGGSVRPGLIVEEQEGDVRVKYATSAASAAAAATLAPPTPYAAWKQLARRCSTGAILTRFS